MYISSFKKIPLSQFLKNLKNPVSKIKKSFIFESSITFFNMNQICFCCIRFIEALAEISVMHNLYYYMFSDSLLFILLYCIQYARIIQFE